MDEATVQRPQAAKTYGLLPKFPSNFLPQEFLGFLRRYRPTDVPRRTARPAKRPVGRPRKDSPRTLQFSSHRAEDSQQSNREKDRENAKRGVYRSYSLRQKLEIVHYARSTVRKIRDYDIF